MDTTFKCLTLYIGCSTNKGRFIGFRERTLIIQAADGVIEEVDIGSVGDTLFLYLMQLNDLDDVQRKQLVKDGLVIGRPHGYTFSNRGFLYLLSLDVDLFGLIQSGFAKDLDTIDKKSL